ncbi:HNH endonuclease [Brachybacterium sp. GCM10030267]|uniref:HNH endonuclease n=1 Tax=Brachybacterium sp. GCM10030267 TaxID=3273381 RepID=UPI0036235649
MLTRQEDLELRNAAMTWLEVRTQDGLNPIGYEDLLQDFYFRGERRALKDRQAGICKPAVLETALSITTTYRAEGKERPYDDAPGPDGLLRYKWHKTDPNHAHNRGLREAMARGLPLIWFWGIAPGLYKPIFPVYLVAEEPELHQFVVATDGLQNFESSGLGGEEAFREYAESKTKRRIHQPVFRGLVMQAYETRCAMCNLRHSALSDAAHIVPDRDERGIAAVRNGLALCKIHHAAYDAGILAVTPDLKIEVREDILDEVDGPILEYGLKRLHGEELRKVPKRRSDRPDRDLLAVHYEEFVRAPSAAAPRIDIGFPGLTAGDRTVPQ